jgi:trk system potassium uptake protein TrkA
VAEQVVVVGLGRFGATLAVALTRAGHEVLGIDRQAAPVRELADIVSKTIQGDGARQSLWSDLPIKGAQIGIVAFSSNVEANVLTAMLLKKMNFKRVVAKSDSELHTELLRAIGVDLVVEPDKESAQGLAHTLGAPLAGYLPVTSDVGIARIQVPPPLVGMSVGALYREKHITVLVIARGDHVILEPKDDEELRDDETALVAGKDRELRGLV